LTEAGAPGEEEADEEELFDIVIVSFALHLVETSSELWALLTELGKRAKWLCVIAPHKKPDVSFPSQRIKHFFRSAFAVDLTAGGVSS